MSDFKFSDEALVKHAQNFLRALHPHQLLVNVCGPIFERPALREFRIGLGGGYTSGYGGSHTQAHAWPVLQAFFENDTQVQNALREAENLGLCGKFGEDQEHNMHVLQYIFDVEHDACVRIRQRAFQDKSHFPGDEAAWQQKFDLYLQQNWTKDVVQREHYRSQFELVVWPQPPRHLWPT